MKVLCFCMLAAGWIVVGCYEAYDNSDDDGGTDTAGSPDVDADTDADTDTGTRCLGDVEPNVSCGSGLICPEEECCNAQGNYCDSQSSCCPNGCMPIGGECCGQEKFCEPGFECINDDLCQPIGGGDADADADADADTDSSGSDICGQYTCERVHQCMGNCFNKPVPTECLDNCLNCSSELSRAVWLSYYNCIQDCKQPNKNFYTCCNTNCRTEISQCFGSYTTASCFED
jgi:hypothetical protein